MLCKALIWYEVCDVCLFRCKLTLLSPGYLGKSQLLGEGVFRPLPHKFRMRTTYDKQFGIKVFWLTTTIFADVSMMTQSVSKLYPFTGAVQKIRHALGGREGVPKLWQVVTEIQGGEGLLEHRDVTLQTFWPLCLTKGIILSYRQTNKKHSLSGPIVLPQWIKLFCWLIKPKPFRKAGGLGRLMPQMAEMLGALI